MVKRQGKREGQYHVWPEYNEGDIRGITFMFCSNCGKEIRDNSNFCPYCGVVKRAIPSETIKQTPVQDTFVSTKKNGSKAFKFCPNCGKAIGENSDFCPYCGSAERAIPSKTAEQTSVQNTSVTAWQNRFKDFLRRKWSEDKGHVVGATLLILSIVCIMVYSAIKHRQEVYIETLADAPEKFVGRDICTEGWVTGRSEEDWIFAVSELPPDTPAPDVIAVCSSFSLREFGLHATIESTVNSKPVMTIHVLVFRMCVSSSKSDQSANSITSSIISISAKSSPSVATP